MESWFQKKTDKNQEIGFLISWVNGPEGWDLTLNQSKFYLLWAYEIWDYFRWYRPYDKSCIGIVWYEIFSGVHHGFSCDDGDWPFEQKLGHNLQTNIDKASLLKIKKRFKKFINLQFNLTTKNTFILVPVWKKKWQTAYVRQGHATVPIMVKIANCNMQNKSSPVKFRGSMKKLIQCFVCKSTFLYDNVRE